MKEPPHPVPNQFKNWLRLVLLLKPYKARFAGGLLFAILYGFSSLAFVKGVPFVLRMVFQPQNQSKPTGSNFLENDFNQAVEFFAGHVRHSTFVFLAILLVPLIMLARSFSSYMKTYLMQWVGLRVITDLRQKVFDHLQRLSLDYYNRANVGDLLSRVSNDCQQAQSAVTTVLVDAIQHPFTLMIVSIALFHEDWKFCLASMTLAPLCVIPITIYGRKVRRTSKLAQVNQGDILSCLHENITGMRVVKAFQMEDYERKRFWEVCFQQFRFQMRIVRSTNILTPMIEIIGSLGASAALYYAYRSHMGFDKMSGLMVGTYILYNPIKELSKIHLTIQKSLASTERLFAIFDTQASVSELPSATGLPSIEGEIGFKDVSFRYDSHWVLQNITLRIPHGKSLALVGPSGAGKTTLLNLIPRFYDPTSGEVLFDGKNIREATLASLRKQIAMVTQETILFHDTIRNNIRYGSFEAADEAVMEAARRAHAHEFIVRQPHAYETIVGEKGAKLSGGQKQRIAIARAILKNPSILLLDEATSALDTESERLVQEALDELIKGRTVVIIAHRLSTVQRADSIVVLEHGRIVEQGSHDDLLGNEKLYRKLYDLQFAE